MKLVIPFLPNSMLSSGPLFRIPKTFRRNSISHGAVVDTPAAPVEEVLTFEQNLDKGFLIAAGKQLILREELLIGQSSAEETEEATQIARDWETLYAKITEVLRGTFNPENDPELLTSAIEAIQQEEEQDRRWEERSPSGDPPAWRPRRCRRLHDSLLQGMVEDRLDNEKVTPLQQGAEELSSLQLDICRMVKRMTVDLLRVVEVVKISYPDDMDICNVYASMYHRALSSRLRDVVAFDLTFKQCINGAIESAEVVLGDRKSGCRFASVMKDFLDSFKKFQDDVQVKSKNRGSPTNSRAVVMTNLNSVELIRVYVEEKVAIFSREERESCLSIIDAMKTSSYEYILSPINEDLKPTYRNLGTKNWLKKDNVFEKLLEGIEKHITDLRGLNPACYQELMSQLHMEVSVEYVRRLLKGKISLKDKDTQERAAEVVCGNCQRLLNFFLSEGSKQTWLSEPLSHIAEVIRLQDINSLQLEVASLASTYPDLSEKHVTALLNLKWTLSKDDKIRVKSAFLDMLSESSCSVGKSFFSKVVVR